MKKIVLLLLIPMFLSACNVQETKDKFETEDLQTVYDSFLADYEKVKTKKYINLDFSNSSAKLPQFVTCTNLNITVECQPTTNKDSLQKFEDYCGFFLGEYIPEYALFSSSSENIVYNQSEDDGKYAWYPKINNYAEQIHSENIKINSLLYRDTDNSKYLWWNMSYNFPHWISNGEAYSYIKTEDTKISSWIPSDMENKVASYFNDGLHNDETYPLFNGDVSIGEAVNYFENDYLSSLPYKVDENFSINVSSIDVYNIKDDLYGYVFNFSTAWNGIPFDSRVETFSYQDTSYQYLISGEALMIKNKEIDTIVDLQFPNIKQDESIIQNICSLESAVEIMSNTLTNGVIFDVNSIEFVYKGDYSSDYKTAFLEPFWKFTIYNPNDTLFYCVYVNAVNGDCSYISYTPLTSLNDN